MYDITNQESFYAVQDWWVHSYDLITTTNLIITLYGQKYADTWSSHLIPHSLSTELSRMLLRFPLEMIETKGAEPVPA